MLMYAPREIDAGDIILRKELSSRILDMPVTHPNLKPLKPTNPFRDQVQPVRVRKRVYTAQILRQDVRDLKFTVVTFEPEDPNTRKKIGALVLAYYNLDEDKILTDMVIPVSYILSL
ncbi:hypothetical protein V5O48_004500 [Marasmius crinis-equi]|uniref:Uncharacterized protein n=1 Tax=Marasmius crinis-equi TaxID=585013 RepID=A0ABR3FQE0_9AGAR